MTDIKTLRDRIRQKRLFYIATPCINDYLAQHAAGGNEILALNMSLIPKEELDVWRKKLRKKDGYIDYEVLLAEYPDLRPVLEQASAVSDAFFDEMTARVEADRQEICRRFFKGDDFGEIEEITTDGADLHNDGKCTSVIRTERGSFLYKPHDLQADRLYAELVRKYFSEYTQAAGCLCMENYGYSEFVSRKPAEDEAAVRRYFRRFGALSSLFQTLGSTDIHMENLFAVGEYPVLIDLETLLCPTRQYRSEFQKSKSDQTFLNDFARSVYLSGILPGHDPEDKMNPLFESSDTAYSLPYIGRRKYTVYGYEDDFLEGFAEGYRKCMQIREELRTFMKAFRSIPIRRLLRNTNDYAKTQRLLYRPKYYADGRTRERMEQCLKFLFPLEGRPDEKEKILTQEMKSLTKGDIPYFYTLGDSTDLFCGGEKLCGDFFAESAVWNAEIRMERLCEKELAFELSMIRECFAMILRKVPDEGKEERKRENGFFREAQPLTGEEALREAEAILLRLNSHRLEGLSGKSGWLAAQANGVRQNIDWGLMSGSAGIGVFASAVSVLSENEEMQQLGRKLSCVSLDLFFETVNSCIEGRNSIPNSILGIGVSDGLGGILRSLMLMRQYMGKEFPEEALEQSLRLLPRLDFEHQASPDVIGGAAGLLQTLCRFPQLLESEEGRRAANRCGDFLLAQRTLETSYGLLWDTMRLSRPISGMGHGMAGIGCSLIAAGGALGREELTEAGLGAMKFEHRIYSEELQNWPDFRETARVKNQMLGYCSGAPGVGLSILSCIRSGKDLPDMREDLERAIRQCRNFPPLYRDHLCCGNSARVDLFLEAFRETKEEELRKSAGIFLRGMTARKKERGMYRTAAPGYRQSFSPSLFFGEPGVGYELLRYCSPESVPSVLI